MKVLWIVFRPHFRQRLRLATVHGLTLDRLTRKISGRQNISFSSGHIGHFQNE